MSFQPRTHLPTHDVTNQPPPLGDRNLYAIDAALQDAMHAFAPAGCDAAHALGERVGSEEIQEAGRLANAHPPVLTPFTRYGERIDEVSFHPAYHQMFALGIEHGTHSVAWTSDKPGGHVTHLALEYLLTQAEAGVCCPITMTYAVIPALRHQPELAAIWEPRATSTTYDPRMIPAAQKHGATFGMAMTEKQGGSDVRANTTTAERDGDGLGWRLRGHKWFCSAPMSDAFLTLAQTAEGLSCFLVPRWLPDGTRNPFYLQRLKDKCGNRSNASSEVEYANTWAQQVGPLGRGVSTIIEMVHHTRLDCTVAAAALERRALTEAMHHATHRRAFGKRLIEQPLMRNVLADLAVEIEAGTWLAMWLGSLYDRASESEDAAKLARIAVAVGKYWTNKRCPTVIGEAMECLGGAGYIEEAPLARLYKEAPLNGIWEGSGNVICLDVLRAASREPASMAALLAEIEAARGLDARLDTAIDRAVAEATDFDQIELRARRVVEALALALQGGLVLRHAPGAVADAYCQTRLARDWGFALGTLPRGVDTDAILTRAWAEASA